MLSRVSSVDDLPKVLKSAASLGEDMVMLLKYGGPNLFILIDKFGVPTVKRAAVYGEGVVDMLNKVPATKLMNDIHVVLKRTGNVFYDVLRQTINISKWLLPVIFGLLSIILMLIKIGVLLRSQSTEASASEQKYSL